jgi:23S rRNA pseudouridine2605 synthase
MTDTPKDETPGSAGDRAPRDAAWQPATDAGSANLPEEKRPARSKAAKAPAGDATLRRRSAPQAAPVPPAAAATENAPEPETAEAEAEPATDAAEIEPVFAGERIAKAIARAGIASRRDAEAMILAGRVSVNGVVIDSPALNVTDDDVILVDGEPMPARERTRLWIFHKPRGLVTTARDPEGRQTVFEVLPEEMPRVVAIGRLDINTEGLLLLTNDGGLAKVIAHPDTGWLRRYRVRAHGDTDQAQLDALRKGVTIDGMEYGPIEATLDRVQGDNLWLTLGLREGKNREVKRILEHLGLQVNRLIRMSFGPFQLGDIEVGLVEEVRTRVLKDQLGKSLSEQAGVDFESPVREPIPAFGGPPKAAKQEGDSRGQARRAPARPTPQRVSTGGTGPGPQRSVWRAESDQPAPYKPGRPPRRGADPRLDQAAAAERGRERVGAIKSGDRRVLVERLSPTPAQPAPEEQPRRRYSKAPVGRSNEFQAPTEGRRERPPFREGDDRRSERPFRASGAPGENRAPRGRFGDDSAPRRNDRNDGPRREGGAPPRHRSVERTDFGGGRSDAQRGPRQDRSGGAPPRSRSEDGGGFRGRSDDGGNFRGRSEDGGGFRGRSAPGGKPFGDRAGGKPGGGRPGGGKPGGSFGGAKSGGGAKPFGAKPGGFKAGGGGGRPGGGSGGGFKPGGSRPGGSRPGGGKPGGRPPRSGR